MLAPARPPWGGVLLARTREASRSPRTQDPALVHPLMRHLVDEHGFRVYRAKHNRGWPWTRMKVHRNLTLAGFPRLPCCWILHFVRPPPPHEQQQQQPRAPPPRTLPDGLRAAYQSSLRKRTTLMYM